MPAPVIGVIAVSAATSVVVDIVDTAAVVTIIHRVQQAERKSYNMNHIHMTKVIEIEPGVRAALQMCGVPLSADNVNTDEALVSCKHCRKAMANETTWLENTFTAVRNAPRRTGALTLTLLGEARYGVTDRVADIREFHAGRKARRALRREERGTHFNTTS